MNFKKVFSILLVPVVVLIIVSCGTAPIPTSDNPSIQLTAFYDLRDRETFIQVTNVVSDNITIHVQIFNVDLNCNENNFYDTLTGFDSHIYNMNNIQTNSGAPSGVDLPDNAYGFVVISIVEGPSQPIVDIDDGLFVMGNFRVIDNAGYEYRTNMSGYNTNRPFCFGLGSVLTFNFNQAGGANLSDIVGIAFEDAGPGCNIDQEELDQCDDEFDDYTEVAAANFEAVNIVFDVDIMDNNENTFSCRDVMFACIEEDNARYEDLLAAVSEVAAVNVAGLEYGINEVFPHSKGSPLLCPNNNITEGTVRLKVEDLFGEHPDNDNDPDGFLDGDEFFTGFVGLNNGNGRGSMDAIWYPGVGGLDPEAFPEECDFQFGEDGP